jgi:hypothetical protein
MKTLKLTALLTIAFIAFSPKHSFSQSLDTTHIEQYCELVAGAKAFSTKVNIDINFGEARKFFKSYVLKDSTGKVESFNSVVDALNYLGLKGWILVNAYPITTGSQNVYHFYFKKSFLKSEVEKAEAE